MAKREVDDTGRPCFDCKRVPEPNIWYSTGAKCHLVVCSKYPGLVRTPPETCEYFKGRRES